MYKLHTRIILKRKDIYQANIFYYSLQEHKVSIEPQEYTLIIASLAQLWRNQKYLVHLEISIIILT